MFQDMEEEHQEFHEHAIKTINLLSTLETPETNVIEEKLSGQSEYIKEEVNFWLGDLKDYETYIKEQIEWSLDMPPGDLTNLSLLASSEPAETKLMKVQIMQNRLAEEKSHFNKKVEAILEELVKFTENSVLAAEKHEKSIIRLNWILASSATIFGLFYGTLLVSFASTIGATLSFLISRILVKKHIERFFSGSLP